MDLKEQIFQSWLQYTTKNEEKYFRQFIAGFVQIWEEKINIDFDRKDLLSNQIISKGPVMQRLPEELLPAIEKFIIISKDEIEKGNLTSTIINETTLLIKCLIIICRQFENIETISNLCYINNCIGICNYLIQMILRTNQPIEMDVFSLIKVTCNFIEALYDPHLTWRNYLENQPIVCTKTNYNITKLHAEVVPFVYYCFQSENIMNYPEIGVQLLNVLSALVCGSQQNGLRAISPATISILISIISKWDCQKNLRRVALKCFNIMTLILQKSSPELRQIELSTIFEMYLNAVKNLLKTDIFIGEKTSKEDINDKFDINALNSIIENICNFITDEDNESVVTNAVLEAKFITTLIKIPYDIKEWNIDLQLFASNLINTLCALSQSCNKLKQIISEHENINVLFAGLKVCGQPTNPVLSNCLKMAFDFDKPTRVVGYIFAKLLEWIPNMIEKQQNFVSVSCLENCIKSTQCKRAMSESLCIGKICNVLENHQTISPKSIINLMNLVEELSKFNISSKEVKQLFHLLKLETNFDYRKQLLESILRISQNTLKFGIAPREYLEIQNDENGITVPDIKKWDSSHGFVFHIWLRLDPFELNVGDFNYRRHVFSLKTSSGNGFEFFIQKNGNFVVSVITKKEVLTATVPSVQLLIGNWHSITVSVAPPKRLFHHYQVSVYMDGQQKLGSTMKFVAFHEPIIYCSIGSPINEIRRASYSKRTNEVCGSPTQVENKSKSIFPNLFEKALPGLVTQNSLSSYLNLQSLKNTNKLDPSVKPIPVGMQDSIFGELVCLKGQIGSVILAECSINIKTLFDAGHSFANIIATDLIESFESNSRFVFCFSPNTCVDGLCLDLTTGNKFNGHLIENYCHTSLIQDSLSGIGGVLTLLPILNQIVSRPEVFTTSLELISLENEDDTSPIKEPIETEWELLNNAISPDEKITRNAIACFLCLLRNFVSNHDLNQECILKEEALGIIGSLLTKCEVDLLDVHVLMAVQLMVETIQNEMPKANVDLLYTFYRDIIFDFRIWARTKFQIIIGHIQYIQAIIKEDRKFFRKHYGIQFMLDVIQEHFTTNDHLTCSDIKTVRESIFRIIKYFLLKDVNIKEVTSLVAFIANIKNEVILLEVLNMLSSLLENKNCKDQLFLLMYEPHIGELLYSLLIEKNNSSKIHHAVLKVINCILATKKVSARHKGNLKLHDSNIDCKTLYPGLFSYILPIVLEPEIILALLDHTLACDNESGYAGALCLIYHLHLAEIELKLEISRRLLTTTFIRNKSPQVIAKQVGWQESIARLLIKCQTRVVQQESKNLVLPDMEEIVKNEADLTSNVGDLIMFDEDSMEFRITDTLKFNKVTELANVIEHEVKELATGATDVFVGQITSAYSVIRQKTSDIQDTFESLALGNLDDIHKRRTLMQMNSSDESMSFDDTVLSTSTTIEDSSGIRSENNSPAFKFFDQPNVDDEETLVYLVSNILFTVLWRGIENNEETWKERGQVMACIYLIALNNELYCSHLGLRLRLIEMGVQATLMDLADNSHHSVIHHQNAVHLLRLAYDLVVLYPNEDDSKKCSTKLLDGIISILDSLMIFNRSFTDEWAEMIMICLGLLLKLTTSPNPDIVAMSTAKLHAVLQSRQDQSIKECGFVIFTLNHGISSAIELGNSESYSFLMPVMKAMLEKTKDLFDLNSLTPDLPDINSGPVFFQNFQTYATSRQWKMFIDKKIKPLNLTYEMDIKENVSEPLNIFWAECFETCKEISNKRVNMQMDSRRKFNERIWLPWRMRQFTENARLNQKTINSKSKDLRTDRRWSILKRYFYGQKGTWSNSAIQDEHWKLSHHENLARMRLKLEPNYYHNPHTEASNLRDNTISISSTRRLSTEITIAPSVLGYENSDEENIQIEEEIKANIEAQAPETSEKEKIVIQQECELISLMMRIKGRLDITTNQVIFTDLSPNREDGTNYDFRFFIQQIREVHLRKFNLRRSALEIFLVDQTNYFLNFTTKVRNKIYSKILSLQPPNILYGSGRSPSELLKSSGYTQKWINREISNFEYLMHLNTIAGRSYNDLSQYPVFPWILADYTSDELDLSKPESFRDLSKPIGVVNPKNESEVRAKYEGFEDPSGMIPKFHYGTHYSNSAGVLHYMIRVEPFTTLHIDLQSGRFDVADRQFHSIPQTWKLLMDNPNDVKELIPEFFYFPEFLKNTNKFDLGTLQNSKERVSDVILPSWAKSPEDFIVLHRRALESEYVSQHLHNWIDLIFGYKQKGPRAVEALNIFYYCSYEGAVDLDKIKDEKEREAVEGMINNFGQTPSQLIREAHPRRLTVDECLAKLIRLELKRPDLTQFLDRVSNLQCDFSNDKDPVIFLSSPRSPPRSFLQTSPDILISITKNGILGCHSWLSFDKDKGFLLEIDATTSNLKNRKRVQGPFHPSVKQCSNLFAVSNDGKYLYAGGIWDNSLRVFNTSRGKVVASLIKHFDVITCVALDTCGSYLVTGSKDFTCIVWSLQNAGVRSSSHSGTTQVQSQSTTVTGSASHHHHHVINTNNSANNCVPKPIHTLYGHDEEVSCVSIMTELDLVVSGSKDGAVNVHTIEEGQYIRTIYPVGCTSPKIDITYLTISYQGHIAFSVKDESSNSVHVYSINGENLGSKFVAAQITGLTTAGEYLVSSDDSGDVTMNKLYGLKPVFDIPLHIPTQTIVVTGGNTHILVPLKDGSLSVVGVTHPNTKKHAVFYV
ncbi:neurobeachin-like protein 1 [Culicoides brevitarsis]|uniref:neurobeachin-like protein 1 n=1 Tax=Culicoides brevitarsis TaxID=469753 RepID=UPI00307BAE3B